MITEKDWINRGYRRYNIDTNNKDINKLADFLLQKRIADENGIKYYITVYCYDRTKYPDHWRNQVPCPEGDIGFMPTCFIGTGGDGPFFNLEINAISSIDEVESYFNLLWDALGKPYNDTDN